MHVQNWDKYPMLAIWVHDLIISEQEFEEGVNALIDEGALYAAKD